MAGAPIFYLASRRLGKNIPTGLALFGLFFALDLAIVLSSSQGSTQIPWTMVALSYTTKLVACYLGGAHAERSRPGAVA